MITVQMLSTGYHYDMPEDLEAILQISSGAEDE